MKRHLYRIFSCLFSAAIFISQSPITLAAQDDVGVVEGRIVNVRDPINNQDAATKNYVDSLIDGISELPAILQSTGKSETAVMSQQAVTNAIDAAQNTLASELNETQIPVVTTTGSNTDLIATVPDWEVKVGKMVVIIPHVTGTSNAITLNVNSDGAKTFTCTDSSGASGDFASSAPILIAGIPVLIVRGATQWNVLSISKPNVNSVNGVLPIANGGTGANTLSVAQTALGIPSFPLSLANGGTGASTLSAAKTALGIPSLPLSIANGGTGSSTSTGAVSNLGMTFATGTWTPVLINDSGTNPTYTASYTAGAWRRIDFGDFHLMFVYFYVIANITNVGNTSGYAFISGLPRTCSTDSTPIAVCECSNMLSGAPNTMYVGYGSSIVSIRGIDGLAATQWKTGTTHIRGAGCYICSAS